MSALASAEAALAEAETDVEEAVAWYQLSEGADEASAFFDLCDVRDRRDALRNRVAALRASSGNH